MVSTYMIKQFGLFQLIINNGINVHDRTIWFASIDKIINGVHDMDRTICWVSIDNINTGSMYMISNLDCFN